MGPWLCYHELRPLDIVLALLAARCSRVEVVSRTCPRCHKLLVSPVDHAASPTLKRSCGYRLHLLTEDFDAVCNPLPQLIPIIKEGKLVLADEDYIKATNADVGDPTPR